MTFTAEFPTLRSPASKLRRWGLTTVLAALPALQPREAHAVPAPWVQISLQTSTIPTDGLLILTISCSTGCADQVPTFTGPDGSVVPMELLDTSDWEKRPLGMVFRPLMPLEPGNYQASVDGPLGPSYAAFEVVDEVVTLPEVTVELGTYGVESGDSETCEVLVPDLGFEPEFREHTTYYPTATLNLSGTSANQFSVRLVETGTEPMLDSSTYHQVRKDELVDEICVDAIAWSYATQMEETIYSECLATDELTLGVRDQIGSGFDTTLRNCVVPPEDYVDEWCQLFALTFSEGNCGRLPLDSCFAARRACPEGDNPTPEQEEEERRAAEQTPPPPSTGGVPGTGGSDPFGSGGDTQDPSGAGGLGAATASDPTTSEGSKSVSQESKGCQISLSEPGGERQANWWIFGVLSLFVGRRRWRASSS